jgi:serine/threonine protein kinase
MATSEPSPRKPTGEADEMDATVVGNVGDDGATAVPRDMVRTEKLGATGASPKPAAATKGEPAKMSAEKSSKSVSQLGDYKILKKLGKGGMGEVYLAHQISLDRQAALKVLSKQLAGKEDFVKRFYREARAMAKLDHPNAVRVYEVREDMGIHYVAMEYIDGKSMQKWMDELGKLSIGDAVHVVMRCAEALQAAHSQNLIHRDIKPDNIMLTSKGAVKVSDFGLAKALDDDLSMTQSGTGLGTPYYMAPEQARNAKHVDGRADIYALGVTLYYFVTGKLPFSGNSTIEVIQNKELGRFTPARKLNPQVSERLELVIDKTLLKDPDHRFKDCAEFMKALGALGLENPSLSFIAAPDKVVAPTAAARSPAASPAAQKPVAVKSSAEVASEKELKSAGESSVLWFVQYKNAQGHDAIGKFSAPQILQMLKAGSLDPRAKAKRNSADSFLPLAQIKEFEKAAQTQMVRIKAEAKSQGLKEAFARIDRQDRWWKLTKKIKGFFAGAFGFMTFLVWLALIFGSLGAVYYFRAPIWNYFAKTVNEMQAKSAAEKAGEKAAERPAP